MGFRVSRFDRGDDQGIAVRGGWMENQLMKDGISKFSYGECTLYREIDGHQENY